ncbi:MAG: NAD(P)H-dependent oxidoreductase [Bacteroidales bacterium]|nr:NAD(P)H-dependent oxidoreductase [Bacteroidales bacterium]
MHLTILNGSPRGKSSNTKILFDQFLKGFVTIPGHKHTEVFLKTEKDSEKLVKIFLDAEYLILGFPLYTDAMPGLVKAFIELIGKYKGENPGLKMGFVVQSGFPEAYHSTFIARYLEKLTKRLGCYYLGTVIRGGQEGIKIQPAWMTRKTFSMFTELGQKFAQTGEYDKEIIDKLARPMHLSGSRLFFYKLMGKIGITNFYWDDQLKENKAFDQRFARPYTN